MKVGDIVEPKDLKPGWLVKHMGLNYRVLDSTTVALPAGVYVFDEENFRLTILRDDMRLKVKEVWPPDEETFVEIVTEFYEIV